MSGEIVDPVTALGGVVEDPAKDAAPVDKEPAKEIDMRNPLDTNQDKKPEEVKEPSTEDKKPEDPEKKDEGEKRSEEHTSELQSLMRTSYAVFCMKKKKQ